MKRKVVTILFLILAFYYLAGCKPSETEFNNQEALELIDKINAAPAGFQIKVGRSDIRVNRDPESSKEFPRYFVNLTDPEVTFDTSIMKEMNYPFPEFKFTFKMEEMVLRHGSKDNYLGFASAAGLHFKMDLMKEMEKFEDKSNKSRKIFSDATVECRIGNLAVEKLDISPLLEENISFLTLISKTASLNESLKTIIEDFSTEMFFKAMKKPSKRIKISVENVSSDQETSSDFIKLYFSSSENNEKRIAEILKEPRTLFKAIFDANNILASVKENGKEKIKATGERVNFSEYLIPSEENGFYKFGFAVDWQNLEISAPKNKILEAAGQIRQAKKELNLDRLSPSFLQAYLEYVRKAQTFKQSAPKETKEEMASFGLRIMNEFFQSQPIITYSLSPLEHRLGRIEAEARFQMIQPGMPPLGKATAILYNLAKFEKGFKRENIMPAEKAKKVMDFIKKNFILDESGNGKLVFEIRS